MVRADSHEMACNGLKPIVVTAGQTQSVTVVCGLM